MEQKRRVTQRDIAEKVGLHRSTVSMVFKNHPGIPEKTRQRVLHCAKELGYAPDPMLSALAIYRTKTRPASFHGTLAWLVNSTAGYDWKSVPVFRQYFEGASERARERGYFLHVFDFGAPGMTPKRLAGILRAQNVAGIQICPQPKPGTKLPEFEWDFFSILALGYSVVSPSFHTVGSAHYRNMTRTISELDRRGYERIGLIIDPGLDQRIDDNFRSRFLGIQYRRFGELPVPVLQADYSRDLPAIRRWVKRYRPEAIVVSDGQNLKNLTTEFLKIGLQVPSEIGVACAGLAAENTGVSGVFETPFKVGEIAMDVLVGLIQRGERGIPLQPEHVHVEGVWSEGRSLCPHRPAAAKSREKEGTPFDSTG